MKLNWTVLGDKKWLVFQLTSFLLAVVGVIIAFLGNQFWIPFVIFSLVLMFLATNRATKLSK